MLKKMLAAAGLALVAPSAALADTGYQCINLIPKPSYVRLRAMGS